MALPTGKLSIAMVPLGPSPHISPSAVKNDLSSTWPDLPPLGDTQKSENTLSFDVGKSAHVCLSLMPGPIPWSDLEGPCATSVLWREAAEVLKPHQAHLLVTTAFDDDRSPIEKSRLLTQVAASVLQTCDAALGVYWCNATLVIQPELFRDFAVQVLPEMVPVHIWVDFRIGPNDDGQMSGFTTGLSALGLMELETTNSSDSGSELRERFEGLIHYLLENDQIINDGDTIGEDRNERISVSYSKSAFGHKEQVMRLDYKRIKKKGWFG